MIEEPPEVKSLVVGGKSVLERVSAMAIRNPEDYLLMADLLKHTKGLLKKLEENLEPVVAQAYKAHKTAKAFEKAALEGLIEAEKLAKAKLEHYSAQNPDETPRVEGLSLSETWGGEVIDPKVIPAEYLVPDLVKLQAVTKALKDETRIPGWKVTKNRTLSVRS